MKAVENYKNISLINVFIITHNNIDVSRLPFLFSSTNRENITIIKYAALFFGMHTKGHKAKKILCAIVTRSERIICKRKSQSDILRFSLLDSNLIIYYLNKRKMHIVAVSMQISSLMLER